MTALDAAALIEKVTALREACIEAKTVSEGMLVEQELRDELLENEALLELLRLARLAEVGAVVPCVRHRDTGSSALVGREDQSRS